MKIRFYNARILQLEDDLSFRILHGELWVEDTTISYIGPSVPETGIPCQDSGAEHIDISHQKREHSDAKVAWDQEIDVEGNLLLPGFKNAHTHSAMTFLRSAADDLPLQKWLFEAVLPREAKLTLDDEYWLAALANLEYLTSGITTIFDMYLQGQASMAKICTEMGMRVNMVDSLNDFGGSIREMEENYLKYNAFHPLVSYTLGVHAEYTTKRNLLEQVAELTAKYRAPFFTHNAETKHEVLECRKRYGLTPTALFEKLGLYDFGGGAYHGVWLEPDDITILADKKLSVVTNPSSNLKLASGIAPIQSLLDAGVNIAIGTDGPASNNCLDMFREMFLVTGLAKVREMDATAVDADQVLYMATTGGAKACNLPQCDRLAVGKQADIIMIDLEQPNMQPLQNIPKNIVYSGSKQNVKMTMIAGKILYHDGTFDVGFAPKEIYEQVEKVVARIM